jgi:tripartite motif-containing protein 71
MKSIKIIVLLALAFATISCDGAAPATSTSVPTITSATSTSAPAITLATLTPPLPTATLPQPTGTPIPSPVEVIWKIDGNPDRFNNPLSLAIDKEGYLYVLDAGNNRIQKFDQTGKFVMMLGVSGAGDGEFNFQRGAGDFIGGLALDTQGNLYVADNQNQRVQKFDSNGNFLLKWGSKGTGDGQFVSPIEVTVDGQGNVYVIDDSRDDIQKFGPNGNFLLKWGGHGSGEGQLSNTGGIAVDGQGNVYVADFGNNRVQKFNSSGSFLLKWGSKGGGNNQFDAPCDVAVDAQGNVYVSNLVPHEESQPRIQKFDSRGNFLSRWGSLGTGNGEFTSPCGIALDREGNVYVADADNDNVQKFRQK